MIVEGRLLAKEVLARAKTRAQILPHAPRVLAVVGSETPATRSYLEIKAARAKDAGCIFETKELGTPFTDADAVVIQLPLPAGTHQKELLDSILLEQDADVLSNAAREKFERGDADALLPPVVAAVAKIFERYGVHPKGKRTVVIGSGFLVGQPSVTWLRQKLASVSVVKDSTSLKRHLQDADIIISGVGSAHLIKPDMLKEGVVLIDAGTSESNGEVAGDADPSCAARCSLFTPVPGGVGPLTVACLFENVVTLAERTNSSILAP